MQQDVIAAAGFSTSDINPDTEVRFNQSDLNAYAATAPAGFVSTSIAEAQGLVGTAQTAITDGTVVEIVPGADGSAQTVTLSPEDVAALGDGTVEVSASQTDENGNQGVAQTAHFTIDTVKPTVDITDDQDGTASRW